MLAASPTCWRDGQHVGVMDNMLAKHATSMSNRPNIAVPIAAPTCWRNMLGRFARGFIVL